MLIDSVKADIVRHSLKEPNKECCGLILWRKDYFIFPCSNESKEPESSFLIPEQDIVLGSEFGQIEGYYHSHPDRTETSVFDRIVARQIQIPLVTYFIKNGQFNVFIPEKNAIPYIGRQFSYNVNDCFTLARDFYLQEFKVKFENYTYNKDWKDKDSTLIDRNIEKQGFSKVHDGVLKDTSHLKEFDIILMGKIGKKQAEHLAIYLGNNKILHHPRNGLSCIVSLDKKLKRLTKSVIRYDFNR